MVSLASYFFNEASSGSAPTEVIDHSGKGNTLTINYDSGDAEYNNTAQGSYFNVTASATTSSANARVPMNTGELGADLEGATAFTIIFKQIGMQIPSSLYGVIAEIGQSGQTPDMRIFIEQGTGIVTFSAAGGSCLQYSNTVKMMAFVFDSSQATAADRLRGYRRTPADSNEAAGYNYVYPAQNSSMSGINDANTYLTLMNRADLTRSSQGGLAFFHIESGALTQQEVFDVFDSLDVNDDVSPLSVPTLTFSSPPSISGQTTEGFTVNLTTSLSCSVDIIITSNGSPQPSDVEFDASTINGNATGFTVFSQLVTGQVSNTTYTVWVRVSDGTTTLYSSVQATTLQIQNTIVSVNSGNPIKYGQTGISVIWDSGATGTTETLINGITQLNHVVVSDTETTFDLVWPATKYGLTGTLNINGTVVETASFIPADGFSYEDILGYNSSAPGTIPTNPTVTNGQDQVVWDTEGGTVFMSAAMIPSFTTSFDGDISVAIVDGSDGSHSAFLPYYYNVPADRIPDQFSLGEDVLNAEPNQQITGNFQITGIEVGQTIVIPATGDLLVSSDGVSYVSSFEMTISGDSSDIVYWRVTSGPLGSQKTGGVSINGIVDSVTVVTRNALVPSINSQPTNQSVTSGSIATFVVGATNASTFQWYQSPSTMLSGQVSGSLSINTTINDDGKQYFCRVFSSEGGYVDTNTVTLTVSPANVSIVSDEVRDLRTGILITDTVLPIRVRRADGSVALTANVTTDGSGIFTVTNNTMGNVGDVVGVEFLDNSFGTYNGFEYTLVAGV